LWIGSEPLKSGRLLKEGSDIGPAEVLPLEKKGLPQLPGRRIGAAIPIPIVNEYLIWIQERLNPG
jgi:hypothetical protein